jgi:hypothetical protein
MKRVHDCPMPLSATRFDNGGKFENVFATTCVNYVVRHKHSMANATSASRTASSCHGLDEGREDGNKLGCNVALLGRARLVAKRENGTKFNF